METSAQGCGVCVCVCGVGDGGGGGGGDGGARVPVVAAQWTSRETGRLKPVEGNKTLADRFPMA